jgi:hypothetical protein
MLIGFVATGMLLFYCRALEICIPLTKGWQPPDETETSGSGLTAAG